MASARNIESNFWMNISSANITPKCPGDLARNFAETWNIMCYLTIGLIMFYCKTTVATLLFKEQSSDIGGL